MMSKYIKIDDLRLHLQNLVLDGERLDPKTTRLIIMTLRELPIHEVEEESMKEGVEKNQFVEANKKGDCISRRQAIEAVTKTIRDKFSFDDWYEQLVETGLEIENLIKELPPVTPTVSEDCISREYMLKLQRELHGWMPNDKSHELWQKIKDAPSVTPTERTGEWVNSKGEPVDDRYSVYCSRCKAWSEYRDIYCGNCGAKMGGDDNE